MIFFLAGCNSNSTNKTTTNQASINLDKNKKLWKSKNIKNYTFVEFTSSFSPKKENTFVTVNDRKPLSVKYIPSNSVVTTDLTTVKSINGYFDIIESAISKDENLTVKYNKTHGYPEEIGINMQLDDRGMFYRVSHFVDSDNAACIEIFTPVCGKVNIVCITTPCKPIEQTFSNDCYLNQNPNASFLRDGEC